MKMRVVLILAALVGLVVAKPSKPEAEAEPFADADDDAELEAATAYDYSNPDFASYGYRVGKRSAEPFYGYGIGYGVVLPTTLENRNNVHGHELASGYAISQPHPGAAGSFQQRTQLHSGYGKRSADADASYGAVATLENRNNVHGHEFASQYAISQPPPGFGGSYQQVSRLHSGLHYGGYYGKRSAEPF